LKAGLSEKSLLANPSPLIFVTVLYMVMFIPLTRFSGLLEKRMKAGQRQIRL
jgi:ABC-type amino acid transport system permease subunit